MGHRRLAGRVSEATIAGVAMLRLDVPKGEGFVTQFYSGGSLYAMTPTTEETAKAVAKASDVAPVSPWEIRGLLEQRKPGREIEDDPDEIDQDRESDDQIDHSDGTSL
jgi:hypothetical protein